MIQQVVKHKFQIIELDIKGAGSFVSLSVATEVDYDEIIGIALFKQGGSHGHGTLKLKIAGDEIFPEKFHADIITLNSEDKNIVLKDVVWEVEQPGKGSVVQIDYKEPEDGATGKLWLYLVAKQTENQEG